MTMLGYLFDRIKGSAAASLALGLVLSVLVLAGCETENGGGTGLGDGTSPGGDSTPAEETPSSRVQSKLPVSLAQDESENGQSVWTDAASLRVEVNRLLQEHVYLLGLTLSLSVADEQEAFDAVRGLLDDNGTEMAGVFAYVYGPEAGTQFLDIWDGYVSSLIEGAQSAVAEDQEAFLQALTDLGQVGQEFSAFIEEHHPELAQEVEEEAMEGPGGLDPSEDLFTFNYDLSGDVTTQDLLDGLRNVASYTGVLADHLAAAMVRDFPEKFQNQGDAAQIQQTAMNAVDAWNRGDIHGFLFWWTDEGLRDEFGGELQEGQGGASGPTRDQIRQSIQEFIGEPTIFFLELSEVEVSDDEATARLEISFGNAIEVTEQRFVKEGEFWKLDTSEQASADIPEDATAVSVELGEFFFDYEASEIPSDGNVAFQVENAGDQPHELALLRVSEENANTPLDQLLQSEGAPGEFIAFGGPWESGVETNMVFTQALDSGRYVMVCFLPDTTDPEGTPHAFKGMVSEFTITGESASGTGSEAGAGGASSGGPGGGGGNNQ
jgi:hypothetical protein